MGSCLGDSRGMLFPPKMLTVTQMREGGREGKRTYRCRHGARTDTRQNQRH